MSVSRPPRGKTYRYDFPFNGRRYAGTTHQLRLAVAWHRLESALDDFIEGNLAAA